MKQRACPVSGARANNEQRPMECSGARSAGGEHPWSQLCFIKRQRSRESQRTLTCVPPQSCPRRSQDVAFGRTDSARRAASYLGSASAMAIAPSFPISFHAILRVFRGVLKNPTESGNQRVRGRRVHHSKARGKLCLTWAAPPRWPSRPRRRSS